MGSSSKGSVQRAKEREERRQEKRAKREARRSDNGLRTRPEPAREERKRFLIVCEGAKTEPNYFKKFCADLKVHDAIVQGCGMNTLSLVEEALQLRDKHDAAFDEVWVVFDRDSFRAETFNKALALADEENIHTAYTNEAFELWYLLHFHYSDADLPRTTYKERLSDALGRTYEKNDESMYSHLRTRQACAIQNAIKLHAQYEPNHNPEKDNPSTSVHRLVCRLNQQRPGAAPENGCWCGLERKHCLGPFST